MKKKEELISRDALLAELNAELRYAELKNSRIMAATYRKVINIINEQKMQGMVSPTECIIYGGDREWI